MLLNIAEYLNSNICFRYSREKKDVYDLYICIDIQIIVCACVDGILQRRKRKIVNI